MFKRPASTDHPVSRNGLSAHGMRGFLFSGLALMVATALAAPTTFTGGANPLIPMAKKAHLPFYVYGDESGELSQFVPSGYMGDVNSLSSLTSAYDESAPGSTGRAGHTSLKIDYNAKGKQGWAAIYWLAPANNWGTIKGAGFDLRKAKKLTFWLRGEKGGEIISQIKMGGVNGPYPDSDSAWLGPITLTREWQQFTIDLNGKDLRHVIGGFMFMVRRADNPRGVTFFMDEVVYRGNPEDEDYHPVAQTEKAAPTAPVSEAGPGKIPVVASRSGGPGSPDWEKIKLDEDLGKEEAPKKIAVKKSNHESEGLSPILLEDVPLPGKYLRYKKNPNAR